MITGKHNNNQSFNTLLKTLKLFIFSTIVLVSCTESTYQVKENYKYNQFLTSFDSSFNDDYYQNGQVKDKLFKELAADFKIQPVMQIGSTLEIRVWLHYNMAGYPKVLIFRNKDSMWFAEKHVITEADFVEGKSYPKKIIYTKFAAPKSGWHTFMDELLGLDILMIPDLKSKTSTATDGELFYFEILTPSVKHVYLRSGEYYAGLSNEDYKIWAILNLIENEFGFKWLDYKDEYQF